MEEWIKEYFPEGSGFRLGRITWSTPTPNHNLGMITEAEKGIWGMKLGSDTVCASCLRVTEEVAGLGYFLPPDRDEADGTVYLVCAPCVKEILTAEEHKEAVLQGIEKHINEGTYRGL